MPSQQDAYQQLLQAHQELTQKHSRLQREHEELCKKVDAQKQKSHIEQELKAKQALFFGLIQSVPDLIFYKDLNGVYLGCNEAFLTFLGKTREELIGKSDEAFYPPEIAANFRESDLRAITEKTPTRHEEWVHHPEKGRILLDTFKTAYFSDSGEPIGLVAISRDITDLYTAQESLARHQKRYRSLFKYNLLGIGISGPESTFIEVNDAFCNMMGYTREELVGQSMELITFPEDIAKSQEQSRILREGKTPFFHFKKRYRRKDGSMLRAIVTASPLSDPNESVEETVVILWDITESEKTEIARKESEEKFRSLFDNIPMMIAFRDLETGTVTEVNRFCQLKTGMAREEVVGKNRTEIHQAEDSPEELALMEQLLRGEIPSFTIEKKYKWGDQPLMFAELTRILIQLQGRKYAVSIINDISSRKAAEKQLREQNEELKKINKELDQFVYSAAHDLRSPLTALMGLVNIIRKEENPALRNTYLELQERSLGKLDHFIQDIVHHSKNARLEVLKAPIDLKTVFEEVFEQYHYLPQAPDIETLVTIDQKETFISDPSRLSVILNSLISNAFRYFDINKDRPLIEVKASVKDGTAHIVISDNGQGIKRDHLQSIFEMFYRANPRTTGSGLGLYITKEAVHKLGGEITVDSEFGHGTTFYLTLPSL